MRNIYLIFVVLLSILFCSPIQAQCQTIFSDDFNRPNGSIGGPWVLVADTLYIKDSTVVGPSNQYGILMYNWPIPIQNVRLNVDFNFVNDTDGRFQFFIWSDVDSVAYIAKTDIAYFGLWTLNPETLLIQSSLQLSQNTLYKMRLQFNNSNGIISVSIYNDQDSLIDSLSLTGPSGNLNNIMLGIENDTDSTKWFDNVNLQKYEVVGIREEYNMIFPTSVKLYQNYPNPFNPTTTIRYDITQNSFVELSLYNAIGQEIKKLYSGIKVAGIHSLVFNAEDLSSGIYYYKIKADGNLVIKKCLLLK